MGTTFFADVLVLEQHREDAHEGHRGGDLAIARAFEHAR
jgi:hypothetical protein